MISVERQAHMLQVGRTAEQLARELFGWSDGKCQQMFLLGYLHDVGYEYASEQPDHPHIGGELLKEAGYQYWQEVRWHGIVDAPYASDELLLLNVVDMLTDGAGNAVTLAQRLDDIAGRYGKDSAQYTDAVRLAESLSSALVPLLPKSPWLQAHWARVS